MTPRPFHPSALASRAQPKIQTFKDAQDSLTGIKEHHNTLYTRSARAAPRRRRPLPLPPGGLLTRTTSARRSAHLVPPVRPSRPARATHPLHPHYLLHPAHPLHRPLRSLKAKNAELTIAKEAEDKVRVVMDEVRGREDAKKPDLPKLFKERDELRKSINEHRDAIRKIQNEFNAERKEYFEFQKVRSC